MKNKFYEIKNKADEDIDIMIYGEIVSGSDKWDESDVTYKDFLDNLKDLKGTETINLYVNSPGGSVVATQGILAMLQRAKAKGVTINSFIDGLGASCASFLPMVADNIYAYGSSLMLVHKPMTCVWGNAQEMQEQIDVLDKIENSVMMPLYMSKAKEGITEDYIKDLIAKETWLDSTEMMDIFNIELLEDEHELVACANKDSLKHFKNVPKEIADRIIINDKETVIEPIKEVVVDDTKELELAKAKLELLLQM